jgi:predicted phosphodiesterase
MIITLISDTHGKHNQITQDLPGGDLLIHAGDISSMGHQHEVQQFCKWFNNVDNYDQTGIFREINIQSNKNIHNKSNTIPILFILRNKK